MATMKKKIISIVLIAILSISLILGDTYKVKAMATAGVVLSGLAIVTAAVIAAEQSNDYQTWYENSYRPNYQNSINLLLQKVGFIPGANKVAEFISNFGGDPIQNARIWLAQESGVNENQITDDQVKQALYNMYRDCNINSNNDSFTFSSNLQSYTQFIANGIIENSGYKYVYSFDILQHTAQFSSGDLYNATRNFCNENQNDYYLCFVTLGSDRYRILKVPLKDYGLVYNSQSNTSTYNYADFYNYSTWQSYDIGTVAYDYNAQSVSYESVGSVTGYGTKSMVGKEDNPTKNLMQNINCITFNGCKRYKQFNTLEDLKSFSVGQQPYYLSDKWNNFINNSGNYTIDNSTVNNITYGDILSYITNYYNNNNETPNDQIINIYIDNNIPDDNGSGGGGSGGNDNPGGEDISGGSSSATATANNEGINININNNHNLNIGGSTVSGNGSGTSSGIGDIFGFLSGVGEALASLVKNLGTALADLLKSLAEVINDIVVGIPDIFSGLINIVFGGLPDDLKSVIILGITVMVVYGLVKMIRG